MPALTTGNSVTITLDKEDTIAVTNATVIYPTGQAAVTTVQTFGPYSGGAVVRIVSTGACAYTVNDLSPANIPITISAISSTALTRTTGVAGVIYELSDGTDKGAKLAWGIPDGASDPTWVWWLWPLAAY